MPVRFCVLASGSGGNASVVQSDGFTLLIDAGLPPRTLGDRLQQVRSSWDRISAAILTHTHTDHWREATLNQLVRYSIPLWCHDGHHDPLLGRGSAFRALRERKLLREYRAGTQHELGGGLRVTPFEVKHDSRPTFAFRIAAGQGLFGPIATIGYAADLGTWDEATVEQLRDCELLALEFNHDEAMEKQSRRPQHLIDRVLSDHGHLSNTQAGRLVEAILQRSTPGLLRQLILLHLSRECNTQHAAIAAATVALRRATAAVRIIPAKQDLPSGWLTIEGESRARRIGGERCLAGGVG